MNLAPIIPQRRPEPTTDPAWAAELKLDGFRGIGDTIRGKMLSKNLNPLKRFQPLLDALPLDCVFDWEICVLDQVGEEPAITETTDNLGYPAWIAHTSHRGEVWVQEVRPTDPDRRRIVGYILKEMNYSSTRTGGLRLRFPSSLGHDVAPLVR
jgi:hypothetical protein